MPFIFQAPTWQEPADPALGGAADAILDGRIGHELIKRNASAPTPPWATKVFLEEPDLVRAMHGDFFVGSAMAESTNSHATHHRRLSSAGHDHALWLVPPRSLPKTVGPTRPKWIIS